MAITDLMTQLDKSIELVKESSSRCCSPWGFKELDTTEAEYKSRKGHTKCSQYFEMVVGFLFLLALTC